MVLQYGDKAHESVEVTHGFLRSRFGPSFATSDFSIDISNSLNDEWKICQSAF